VRDFGLKWNPKSSVQKIIFWNVELFLLYSIFQHPKKEHSSLKEWWIFFGKRLHRVFKIHYFALISERCTTLLLSVHDNKKCFTRKTDFLRQKTFCFKLCPFLNQYKYGVFKNPLQKFWKKILGSMDAFLGRQGQHLKTSFIK
jgi:hypothetical protein